MSTLGTLILIVFAIIAFGALCLAFADRGDDTTDWDLTVTTYAPAEVVEAQPWPQPQTVLHDKLPLNTPASFAAVPCDDRGTPLWWHEHKGTTPVYDEGSHSLGRAPGTVTQRARWTQDTGAWDIREITSGLVAV